MNTCRNYQIPCPWAIDNSELPCCVDSQKSCDTWRERVRQEAPQVHQVAQSKISEQARFESGRETAGLNAQISQCYH